MGAICSSKLKDDFHHFGFEGLFLQEEADKYIKNTLHNSYYWQKQKSEAYQ